MPSNFDMALGEFLLYNSNVSVVQFLHQKVIQHSPSNPPDIEKVSTTVAKYKLQKNHYNVEK